MNATTASDPLAYASTTPNITALITEALAAQFSQVQGLGRIHAAEAERYQDRDGKDGSGRLWQKNLRETGALARPWDGCPDPDASLTDEICENEVDQDLVARAQAVPGATSTHLTPATAAAIAEVTSVMRYVARVVEADLDEHEELLAQTKTLLGLAILHPYWLERYELVERTLDIESFITKTAQAAGPDNARALYTAILDPTLEAAAISYVSQLFAYVPKARIRTIVRELRETGRTVFLDRQLAEKRPALEALIPGYNYFVSGSGGSIKEARLHLKIKRYHRAALLARAADENWNADFVARAVETGGQFSIYAEPMRRRNLSADLEQEDRLIEIWETCLLQFDEATNAAGLYCTIFSPHLSPGGEEATEEDYARHWLLGGDGRCPPFIVARREVNGPGIFDTRGVPDVCQSNSSVIRNLQKAAVCRAHLEVDPPRALIGAGWSKKPNLTPGAMLETLMPGADIKDLGPQRGNPAVGEAAIERVQRDTHRLFAFADAEIHPARWQPRALRKARRALAPYREAFTQLTVMCYQNFEPWELAEVIGHEPRLTAQDVLQHRITLKFDPRSMDNDWLKDTRDAMIQILGIDRGGIFDTNKLGPILAALIDPTLASEISQDQAGASAKLYRKVSNDVMDIMAGNPPPLVEMDPTAGMQLKMAFQIIGQNEDYQRLLQSDGKRAENMKTYMKNLRHSEQETQISPQQGRLGVAAMPQRPVQEGAAAM